MTNHLAIMRNPWMNYLVQGKKTIESRISQKQIAPWQKVNIGDWIYFRLSGDFVVSHKAAVKDVKYYEGPAIFQKLEEFKEEICIDDEYIHSKSKCKYLTLIWLDEIISLGLDVFPHRQKGQQAWFVNIF